MSLAPGRLSLVILDNTWTLETPPWLEFKKRLMSVTMSYFNEGCWTEASFQGAIVEIPVNHIDRIRGKTIHISTE